MHLYNAIKIGDKYFKYFGFRRFETGEYLPSRPNSPKVRYAPEIVRKGGRAHAVQRPVSKVKDLKHKIVFGWENMFVPWAGRSVRWKRIYRRVSVTGKVVCRVYHCGQSHPTAGLFWAFRARWTFKLQGGVVSVEHARWRRLVCGGVCMYRGRNLSAWQRQVLELTGVQQRQQGSLGPLCPASASYKREKLAIAEEWRWFSWLLHFSYWGKLLAIQAKLDQSFAQIHF